MEKIAGWLRAAGLPEGDDHQHTSSPLRFPDGAHYRIEISGVETVEALEALVDEMRKTSTPVHRLVCTVSGATYLRMSELRQFAQVAAEAKLEVMMTPGPRPQWETGKQVITPEGAYGGMRCRGMDSMHRLLADVDRCLEAGIRGFLLWGEDALDVLATLRSKGLIPPETVFKVSINAGHANAAGARLLERLGANTWNPVADLGPAELAAIRKVTTIPMDVHALFFESYGGQIRFWETAELARVAAPCYFKIEPGVSSGTFYRPWVGPEHMCWWVRKKVHYAGIIQELVERWNPDVLCSAHGPADLSLPRP
ncbi:MAG: hypothetical protein Q8P31_01475 [Bacillota bacterium]|nr:hypothetical protein [Bacillota bacterium]